MKIRLKQFKNWLKQKRSINKNLRDFFKEEKREVYELASGQQGVSRYLSDSKKLFIDYFIPNKNNNYRPKILAPRPLWYFAIILTGLKILLVSYIFIIYNQQAEMSATMLSQLHILTNESRVINGLKPLNLNLSLSQSAQMKAEDMIIHNYFAHTSPDGRRLWTFMDRNAYPYLLLGENLAMNFLNASDVHKALMASPSHQKNILNPKYTDIGLSVVSGEIYGQTSKVLVQIFAYQGNSVQTNSKAPTPISTSSLNEIIVAGEEYSFSDIKSNSESKVFIYNTNNQSLNRLSFLWYLSKVFYILFLFFLSITLLINIFVNLKIQHRSVITQTLLLIILVISLISFDFSFIKEISNGSYNIFIL